MKVFEYANNVDSEEATQHAGLPWVREKYLENEMFSTSGKKSGNLVDGQGNRERTWKVREKSENLKINGYGR